MSSPGPVIVLDIPPDQYSQSESTKKTGRLASESSLLSSSTTRCWICLCDSTEDDLEQRPVWRAPCPCNLTAHEACLLDWISDVKRRTKDRRRTSIQIPCPQCKTEIKISRPRSSIVDATRVVDRTLYYWVWPGFWFVIFGTLSTGAWVHGFQSVLVIFGRRSASEIYKQAARHPGWLSTYALIPVHLILSRTRYGDVVLPTSTLLLVWTQLTHGFQIDSITCYPPPSTVFACLPVLRSFYNWSYNKGLTEQNKMWLMEMQAPARTSVENVEEHIPEEPRRERGRVDLNPSTQQEVSNGGGNESLDGNGVRNNRPHFHVAGDDPLTRDSSIGQLLLGALAFPYVAAGMGGLLRLVLPRSWTSSTSAFGGRSRLLQHRWGRSMIGGCLFVVVKDALGVYCRWRLVQSHRHRRIVDYDKEAQKYLL